MFKKMRKYLIFILPLFFAVTSFNNVSAARTSNADLYKKSLIMGVKTCYQKYAKSSINYKDFSDYMSIFEGSGFSKISSDDVWITTHVGNSLNSGGRGDSNLSCQQVFAGYRSQAKGLKDYYTIPSDLEKLGYVFNHVEGAATSASGTTTATTDQITFKIDSVVDSSNSNSNKMQVIGNGISCNAEQIYHDGLIFKYHYWEITGCSGKTGISYNGEELFVLDGDINDGFLVTGTGTEIFPYNGDHFAPLKYYTFSHTSEKVSLESEFVKTNFLNMLKTDTETAANKYYSSPSATVGSAISTPKSTDKTNPSSVYKPKNDSKTKAATVLIQNLGASFALIGWTSDDKYSLYYQYLLDIQKSYPDININQCSTEKPSSGWAFKNSSTSWCIINIPTSSKIAESETLSVLDGDNGLKEGTFNDVLNWFNDESNYNGVSEDTYANASTDENGDLIPEASTEDADGDEREATCINSGAMSSLGWVICPILDIMNNATNVLYNDFVEPALYVDVSLFSVADSNTDSAVKSGWETFRNFANTFFIILFLVVIVSQLTGVGLNNYNIKKILPRLIVAAILINLSYVICQVCIDISNILGRGIMDFFDNIEVSMPTSVEGMGVSGFATGTLTAVILIGTILAGVWFILSAEGWSGIVVIIVLAAISIVTSLLFLFLVLAAREAAVIILVIISPVAVVAYMLPNTKTLIFDKWKKLFQNLLVVYPVCGFIVGGGNFVSKILLSAGAESGNVGFFSAFAAMLVGILPIFFIPKLVRQSLSAVGDIGTKISNFGRGVSTRGRKGAEKFAENSEHIKQWKAGSADRFQAFKNRRGMRSGNARVRARAVESESARLAANAKINRLSNPDGIRRRLSAVQAAEEDKAYDEAISQRLALMNSGGEDGGVRMRDGSRRAYTLDNMLARVREIEDDSRGRQLTADERQEFGALARGIVNEKGGAGQLHRIVRHSGETHDANGNVTGQNLNENFMQAMGDIYSQDATVKSKMREKDAGDSAYIETFMPGGAGAQPGGGRTFQDFRNSPNLNDAQGRSDYQMAIDTRVRSYEAGLNQGGEALQEYIDNLNRADCQTIRDNDELYYSMDVADRQRFDARARTLGVTGPSNTNVNIVNPGPNPGPTP